CTLSNIVIEPSVSETEQLYNGSYVVLCHGEDTFNTTWRGPDGNIIQNKYGRVHIEETMIEFEHHSLLVFQNVITADRGKYTCTSNVRGELQQASFTMSVVKRLYFNEPSRHQKLIEGHNMMVICDAHGDPTPNVTWYFNDYPLFKKRGGTKRFSQFHQGLQIRNVSLEDEGSYLCQALQTTLKSTFVEYLPIYVEVLYKPRWPQSWSSRDNEAYGYLGGTTNITCHAGGNPIPGYAWTKDNRTLDFSYAHVIQEEKRSILQVRLFHKRVLGKYECMADNRVGRIWKTFILREGRKPETPIRVRIAAVTGNTALVAIDASNERTAIGFRFEFVKVHTLDFSPAWIHPDYQDVPITDDRYMIVDLIPNTHYKLRVATKSIAGLSDFTEEIGFTTSKGPRLSTSFALIITSVILKKIFSTLHTNPTM
ncbi:neural cell adhesion molecule 2-like, partial [Cimex lectularius]|uniref:Neural cell adhesion molecule 2 n=1 Tax=Cimex lectularius TaxID=79782 RepID=A0A8I6SQW6_CIMLE